MRFFITHNYCWSLGISMDVGKCVETQKHEDHRNEMTDSTNSDEIS